MKLFLGLTSVLVICVMLMSLDKPKATPVVKKVETERNTVLDRLVELGSKCLYLENKWEDLETEEKFNRLQEANALFGEFEYLQLFIKSKTHVHNDAKSLHNYALAAYAKDEQFLHVKALRKTLDEMYKELVKLHFNDAQLFEALNLVTFQLDTWNTHRKSAVLKGITKAMEPFKEEAKMEEESMLFEQLENLCSTAELVKSKDVEGLYILSLKSALHEIEYFVKNRELDETNYKV
ncbi:hypothetical protein SAMN05216474_2753 [Lishizhenia tianjinensis]|uniref:Uncharacterized protein n=1 Tax=Lishizhenia tianjinensis TaxID=477690 RepID=A0A1I7BEP0_9FLAO|nr:hypothetical protein [Lishizhenia tianjinensis]SFT85676.1 hypothetical protein SAMN05216474_2753 [Lishizhenia tianjinensis]